MSYSAVLIDDEIHCTESLQLLLNKAVPEVKVAAKFNNAAEAITYLRSHTVDFVLLDIEMPEMSGFEMLNAWEQLPFDVIFVTAYDQYAIKAFTYSAISYLLKPVDEDDLKSTVKRWQEKKSKILVQNQLSIMQQMLNGDRSLKTKVALPTFEGLEFLEIQNITRCESEGNYTWLFCADGSKRLICRTLKEVEKVLSENGFIRVHQSHLVNPRFIRKFVRQDGGFIVMDDGHEVSVSRTKKDRLFEFFSHVERL
jgi:two-component system LytT family response regulator